MRMAKRPTPPSRAILSPDEILTAIPQIDQRVEDLKEFDPNTVTNGSDPAVKRLESRIEQTLARVFGPDSHEYHQLQQRGVLKLDLTTYPLRFDGGPSASAGEIRLGIERGRQRAIALLEEAARGLREALQHMPTAEVPLGDETALPTMTKEVFIVHGHDVEVKTQAHLFLKKAGLNPIILHEQANEGRTIIEKFEKHASVAAFAVVLLTPDDEGGPKGGSTRPRARQNVVLELGWFAGKLGRHHVCALKQPDVEMPSDFSGVGYVDLDDRGGWKADLLRELQAAGFTPDWANAMA
jgi:predicted nucleotide-binding protein